jgi:hypothetical protein
MAPTTKVGLDVEWILGGRSLIVDPFGEIVGQASDEADVIVTEVSPEHVYAARWRGPMLRDRRPRSTHRFLPRTRSTVGSLSGVPRRSVSSRNRSSSKAERLFAT